MRDFTPAEFRILISIIGKRSLVDEYHKQVDFPVLFVKRRRDNHTVIIPEDGHNPFIDFPRTISTHFNSLAALGVIVLKPIWGRNSPYLGQWIVNRTILKDHPQHNEIIAQVALGT